MKDDVQPDITKPFGRIGFYDFSTMFRALSNAAIAIEAFTNRQNYGPAIQQLIYDLGELCEIHMAEEGFDLPKLVGVLGKICDRLDADDFNPDDDVEVRHGSLYLWDHTAVSEERLKFYKNRYSWEEPVEET